MTLGSLFAGIGGFELAATWAGIKPIWSNEIDPFCCQVLRKNFNHRIIEKDIREIGKENLETVDIISGGFPCQPFSTAGKRKGRKDDRYLWPEMLRVISELKPQWVIGENVAGLKSMENGKTLERILHDLEDQGYQTETYIIPACGVQAWHRRDRVWIIAHFNSDEKRVEQGVEKRCELDPIHKLFHPDNRGKRDNRRIKKEIQELKGIQRCKDFGRRAILGKRSDVSTPVLCRSYDGIPNGLDRLKSLGNAIVPQVAYEIFKAIKLDMT